MNADYNWIKLVIVLSDALIKLEINWVLAFLKKYMKMRLHLRLSAVNRRFLIIKSW